MGRKGGRLVHRRLIAMHQMVGQIVEKLPNPVFQLFFGVDFQRGGGKTPAADEVQHFMRANITACKKTGAAWGTQRRSSERVCEIRTFARNPVDVRRLHKRMARISRGIEAQIANQNKNEIWALRLPANKGAAIAAIAVRRVVWVGMHSI